MATVSDITTAVTAAQTAGDGILDIIENLDPGATVPAEVAEQVLDVTAQLVSSALAAYVAATGTPITPETIAALAPNPAPLSQPDPE